MRRLTIGAVLAVLVLAGCGWTQPDFDAGRSRGNEMETTLTTANASSLVHSTISDAVVGVIGNTIIAGTSDVVGYDAATCPNSSGVCTPVWTRSNRQWGGSDGSRMVFTVPGTLTVEVTDLDRNVLWTGTAQGSGAVPDGVTRMGRVAVSGGKVIVEVDTTHSASGIFADEVIDVFPIAGCGHATCTPTRKFVDDVSNYWVAGGDTLIRAWSQKPGMVASNMTTGATSWSTPDVVAGSLLVRDGKVDVWRGSTDTAVYDLAGVQSCTGTPGVCSAVRVFSGTLGSFGSSAFSDHLGAVPSSVDSGHRALTLFAPDGGTGCPSACAPLATTAPVAVSSDWSLKPTVTANLVFVVEALPYFNEPSRTFHLLVYDARATAGCAGTPKVCSPVADVPFAVGYETIATPPIVAGGRVYVGIRGGTHVFSLPT